MPYTEKQRRYFHAKANDKSLSSEERAEFVRLAAEADDYAGAGKEKSPVKRSKQKTASRPIVKKHKVHSPVKKKGK